MDKNKVFIWIMNNTLESDEGPVISIPAFKEACARGDFDPGPCECCEDGFHDQNIQYCSSHYCRHCGQVLEKGIFKNHYTAGHSSNFDHEFTAEEEKSYSDMKYIEREKY